MALCAVFIFACTPLFTVLGAIDSAMAVQATIADGHYDPLACGDTT